MNVEELICDASAWVTADPHVADDAIGVFYSVPSLNCERSCYEKQSHGVDSLSSRVEALYKHGDAEDECQEV